MDAAADSQDDVDHPTRAAHTRKEASLMRATVSGSFHHHLPEVTRAVEDLRARGVEVLSPAEPRIVDHLGDFLFVASDRLRSIRLVQDRHVQAIRASDFLWLVAPYGYVGSSASFELGCAYLARIPVFSVDVPADATLREYVRVVRDIDKAIAEVRPRDADASCSLDSVLLDPARGTRRIHDAADRIERALSSRDTSADDVRAEENVVRRLLAGLR
jgi:hypothetical protein